MHGWVSAWTLKSRKKCPRTFPFKSLLNFDVLEPFWPLGKKTQKCICFDLCGGTVLAWSKLRCPGQKCWEKMCFIQLLNGNTENALVFDKFFGTMHSGAPAFGAQSLEPGLSIPVFGARPLEPRLWSPALGALVFEDPGFCSPVFEAWPLEPRLWSSVF